MPRPLPPAIVELQKRYQSSQTRLIDIIAKQETRGNVTNYRKALLKNVNAEINSLDTYAKDWMNGNIPKEYTGSIADVYKYLDRSVPASVVRRSTKAADIIAQNAIGDLQDAHQFVGRVVKDNLRQAGVDAVAMKLSVGNTVKQTKKNLIQIMTDRGITAIRDKNGREIKLDVYADMIARTTTREATNQGTLAGCAEVGSDLVQMTGHNASCPICAPLENRVFSISGKDKRYPPLSAAFPSGYSTIHPSCRHSVTPYFEKFDNDADKTRSFSARPITQDPRSKAQMDQYMKEQAYKRDLRNDRNQWERYRTTLPNAPKTLSGFRRMKKANGENWTNLQGKFADARGDE